MAKQKAIVEPAQPTAEQRYEEIENELVELTPLWDNWQSLPTAEFEALKTRNDALLAERKRLQDEYAAQMRARQELEKLRAAGVGFLE